MVEFSCLVICRLSQYVFGSESDDLCISCKSYQTASYFLTLCVPFVSL